MGDWQTAGEVGTTQKVSKTFVLQLARADCLMCAEFDCLMCAGFALALTVLCVPNSLALTVVCVFAGLDCLMCLDSLMSEFSGLDCLMSGRDCLMCAEFAREQAVLCVPTLRNRLMCAEFAQEQECTWSQEVTVLCEGQNLALTVLCKGLHLVLTVLCKGRNLAFTVLIFSRAGRHLVPGSAVRSGGCQPPPAIPSR